ncbi:MAG: LTA synthase family protein [Proteobacteria bacterium]|uniref:LTA synthase family protein n=1 Tax=Rudaea sp. TaxID=2136325 RepID=UPI00321F7E42|nr:LTA synthase family protein [Pseudomonadota bacterium]
MPKPYSAFRSATAKDSRRKGLAGAAILVVFLLILFGLRGLALVGITTGLADCPWCMGATAIQQDASILALLLAFTGLSLLTARYWLQLPWLLLSALLLLAYALDAVLLKTLVQHLYWLDIVKFGKEIDAIGRFGNVLLASGTGKLIAVGVIAGLLVLVLALLPRPRRPRLALVCFVVACLCFLVGQWSPMTMKYINYPLLQNFIAANLADSVDRHYSTAYADTLRKEYVPPAPVCEAGRGLRPNIIIVAVESLSMYHSKLFGDGADTPHLDAIAQENTWFPDFIANGFTTDSGLIAMITGKPPIPTLGRYQSAEAFAGFESPEGALPDIVHAHGYTTHFFTTGDLGFLDKSTWLKELGFDSWEGAEQPFYNGWKRRHFNAAEDKALYQRFLQWLDARPADSSAPWLAFVLTVSTHPPFVNPENESLDETGAFRYADKQIGMLYDELGKRDFFRNGVLMISGDHRSMTPLSATELARFGDSALARTPFVVATQLPIAKGAVAGKFQQVDIAPSIAELLGDHACRKIDQGTFLSLPPQPARYIAHARGDRRNQIDIYFDGKQADLVLAGDQSNWIGPKPDNWKQIMDGIALDRIGRGTANENFLDLMINARAPKQPESSSSSK